MQNVITFIRIIPKMKILLWLIFALLLFKIPILTLLEKPKEPIDTKVIVYEQVDSLSKSLTSSIILTHNKLVINILQTRGATCENLNVSRENNLKQSRTIYIVLIAVLLTWIIDKEKTKNFVIVLILFLITGMFGVEVHVQDLLVRSSRRCSIVNSSVEQLVNSPSIDSIWYRLNYTEYRCQGIKAKVFLNRIWRKLWSAYNPDGEQLGFYVIPFLLLYVYLFWVIIWKKEDAKSE